MCHFMVQYKTKTLHVYGCNLNHISELILVLLMLHLQQMHCFIILRGDASIKEYGRCSFIVRLISKSATLAQC